jgi:hypothetical protein
LGKRPNQTNSPTGQQSQSRWTNADSRDPAEFPKDSAAELWALCTNPDAQPKGWRIYIHPAYSRLEFADQERYRQEWEASQQAWEDNRRRANTRRIIAERAAAQ